MPNELSEQPDHQPHDAPDLSKAKSGVIDKDASHFLIFDSFKNLR